MLYEVITPFVADAGVKLGNWGEIIIDPATCRTSHPKIFAGGDCQRGADLVVTAAADGRLAAMEIVYALLSE